MVRRLLVDDTVGVAGVAEVELADGVVRVMQCVVGEVVRHQVQLARRELVVAVHRRRHRVRQLQPAYSSTIPRLSVTEKTFVEIREFYRSLLKFAKTREFYRIFKIRRKSGMLSNF